MTLEQTSMRVSGVPASMHIKVYPLGKSTLERFIERRVTGNLQSSQGVTNLNKTQASYGGYQGMLITLERQYASGLFKSANFVFTHGHNAFILELTTPAEVFDRERSAQEAFAVSLRFQP